MRRLLPSQNRELPIETNLFFDIVSESVVNLPEELSEALILPKFGNFLYISTRHVYTFEGHEGGKKLHRCPETAKHRCHDLFNTPEEVQAHADRGYFKKDGGLCYICRKRSVLLVFARKAIVGAPPRNEFFLHQRNSAF